MMGNASLTKLPDFPNGLFRYRVQTTDAAFDVAMTENISVEGPQRYNIVIDCAKIFY
ncbi:hypothetical protein B932_3179 [Gluconobacter oxydans H24]|nr:hypothetical protein B932_3179 [Gluconobacter oxydans H24]